MGHVTRMNGSCRTYEWVMSHIRMGHVAHMNESCRCLPPSPSLSPSLSLSISLPLPLCLACLSLTQLLHVPCRIRKLNCGGGCAIRGAAPRSVRDTPKRLVFGLECRVCRAARHWPLSPFCARRFSSEMKHVFHLCMRRDSSVCVT